MTPKGCGTLSPRAWACYSRPSAWQPEWVFPARAEGAAGNHLSSSPVDAWKGFRTETSCADVEVAAVFDCHDALGKVETKAGALADRVWWRRRARRSATGSHPECRVGRRLPRRRKKSSSREVRIDSVPCPPMALTALSSAFTRHYLEGARNTDRTTITV